MLERLARDKPRHHWRPKSFLEWQLFYLRLIKFKNKLKCWSLTCLPRRSTCYRVPWSKWGIQLAINRACKQETNKGQTLAYFVKSRYEEEKKFYNIENRCQCYKTFFLCHLQWGGNKLEGLPNPFQSDLRIWGQGQSKPNWRTFQMLPSWVSSWCYQHLLD